MLPGAFYRIVVLSVSSSGVTDSNVVFPLFAQTGTYLNKDFFYINPNFICKFYQFVLIKQLRTISLWL